MSDKQREAANDLCIRLGIPAFQIDSVAYALRQAYADGRDAGIEETTEHCKELTENAMDTDDLLAIPRRLRSLKTKGAK